MGSKWGVIGAGPAGIITVGKFIDYGINPSDIIWIDPEFQVGDFGTKWQFVQGNSTVGEFKYFLNSCKEFKYEQWRSDCVIDKIKDNDYCTLDKVSQPLKVITNNLLKKVTHKNTFVKKVLHSNGRWNIITQNCDISVNKIVLAIGSEPKRLNLSSCPIISLPLVFNTNMLHHLLDPSDIVGVVGSSHSAIIAIYNLITTGVKVINFYRSPLKYAVTLNDHTIFDYSGLKGTAAEWAKCNMDNDLHPNLQRFWLESGNNSKLIKKMQQCTKIVYAIGFQKRIYPVIEPYVGTPYDPYTGVIAPGLFGIGIAFPQLKTDIFGRSEHAIGLKDFSLYIDQVINIWIKY